MKITGILLAAGMSKRMNQVNKLMLPFRSSTIVEESLKNMTRSSLDQVIVVLGHESSTMTDILKQYQSKSISLVYNPDYQTGRASSIRCAMNNLDKDTEAALFMVADKPTVSPALIDQALEQFTKVHPPLLGVRTPQGRGHPIIFGRELFDELSELEGDHVGQQLIAKYQDEMLWLDDDQEQINVNTKNDCDRLIKQDALSNASGYQRERS